jgi:hypothetical protein
MERIRILDPTAPPPAVSTDPGPDAGSLEGKTIGFRFDETWQSFFHVRDEWVERFEKAGAKVRVWNAGHRVGEDGEQTRRELEEFAEAVDIAVVGLGN